MTALLYSVSVLLSCISGVSLVRLGPKGTFDDQRHLTGHVLFPLVYTRQAGQPV